MKSSFNLNSTVVTTEETLTEIANDVDTNLNSTVVTTEA